MGSEDIIRVLDAQVCCQIGREVQHLLTIKLIGRGNSLIIRHDIRVISAAGQRYFGVGVHEVQMFWFQHAIMTAVGLADRFRSHYLRMV